MKKAIITVSAKDTVGIIAFVSTYLAEHNINILDISQTIMQEYFVMIMLVDVSAGDLSFEEFSKGLTQAGQDRGVDIHVQREDLFKAMNRV